MLLVIVGHTVTFPLLRGAIFSFHMPLFFLIAGVNYHSSNTKEELIHSFVKTQKRLIIPAVCLYLIRTTASILSGGSGFSPKDILLTVIYSSGVKFESRFGPVSEVGMVWFLVCLFECRVFYDTLYYKFRDKVTIIVSVLACLGVYISKLTWLPFSLDITMVVLLFFFIGVVVDKYGIVERLCKHPRYFTYLIFLSGGGMILELYLAKDYLELATRSYPMFPICLAIAVILSIIVLALVKLWINARKENLLSTFLITCGKNSLLLFSVHYLDSLWSFTWKINSFNTYLNQLLSSLFRVFTDILVFYMLLMIFKWLSLLVNRAKREKA